jgi:ABC-type polysaccharide/polyol phosphate transport system ATPase subunit
VTPVKPTIELTDVGLAYRLSRHGPGSLKELAIGLARRHVRYERLRALRGIDLTVGAGEVLGVVGVNGAGKSSLIKVIAGILPPTEGRVVVRGKVAAMIELGAGFSMDLTGRENIVLYGALLGQDPGRQRRRVPEIAEWAELTDFLDVPVRSYSLGMLARLGFAICTDADPEILIVDEVMAVGDAKFVERAGERMDALISGGTSVVLVSHDPETILDRATRVIWLEGGAIRAEGEPADVLDAYLAAPHVAPGGSVA